MAVSPDGTHVVSASASPYEFVELNTSSAVTVTVDYTTVDGTALAGTDYTATSGMLTFPPTAVIQNFSVTLIGTHTNPRDCGAFRYSSASPPAVHGQI